MASKYTITLAETFSDFQDKLIDDTPAFFTILSYYFDIDEFIPLEFRNAFYRSVGRNGIYSLQEGSYCLYLTKDLFHSYRCLTSSVLKSLQGIKGFLCFFQSTGRFPSFTVQT